jgi:hypothetical protein
MTDDAREEAQYLANPLAFWLRTDRHEHGVECWMIDEPYVPKPPVEKMVWRGGAVWQPIDPEKEGLAECIRRRSLPVLPPNTWSY